MDKRLIERTKPHKEENEGEGQKKGCCTVAGERKAESERERERQRERRRNRERKRERMRENKKERKRERRKRIGTRNDKTEKVLITVAKRDLKDKQGSRIFFLVGWFLNVFVNN